MIDALVQQTGGQKAALIRELLMKEAAEALKATGVSNPSTTDITEYLIQKQTSQ
jgi:hypothetical protein